MSFQDGEGNASGYSIDLCDRIANGISRKLNRTDLQVKYIPVDAKSRFKAVAKGRIDILCGATTVTLQRRELVDFTQLTFITGGALLSLTDNKVVTIKDLQNKKVGVVKNTTTIAALEEALDVAVVNAEIVPMDSASDAIASLAQGKIDVFSSDQVVLIGLVQNSDDIEKSRFYLSPRLISLEPFALAVTRDDAEFRLVADTVLAQLYRTGQIMQIYNKWFGKLAPRMPPELEALYVLNAIPE